MFRQEKCCTIGAKYRTEKYHCIFIENFDPTTEIDRTKVSLKVRKLYAPKHCTTFAQLKQFPTGAQSNNYKGV